VVTFFQIINNKLGY